MIKELQLKKDALIQENNNLKIKINLMYFERETQHDIFIKFYDALREPGFLILGMAETIIGCPS